VTPVLKAARTFTAKIARIVRGVRPDRNPLRRRYDRVEAAIGAGLLMTFLAGAPLLAIAAGQWAHSAGEHAERTARADAHQVRAVLLHAAPPPALALRAATVLADEPARWTSPDGLVRTASVPVPGGTKAGATLLLWTDSQGRLTTPPPLPSQITDQVILASVFTAVAVALAAGGAWLAARRVLHARRLRWWEAQWSATGPRWTSRR
jgi:hypothetical protein